MNLENETYFSEQDVQDITAHINTKQNANTNSQDDDIKTYTPSDLSGLGLQILQQAIQEEKTIADQLSPYLKNDERIRRVMHFLAENQAQDEPITIPNVFGTPKKFLPTRINPSLI